MLVVQFAFVHPLLFQLFTLSFLHLCHLFPPLSLHLSLAFLDSEATFDSRYKLTCRLVMSECIYCIDLAFKLVMILPTTWRCKISSTLSPITMASLLYSILVHGQIDPIIISPSLSYLLILVIYESIDETFLVEARPRTVILQALRLSVFNFFDVWSEQAIILSDVLVLPFVVVSVHRLSQLLSMFKICLYQALLRLLKLYQFLVALSLLFLLFQELLHALGNILLLVSADNLSSDACVKSRI